MRAWAKAGGTSANMDTKQNNVAPPPRAYSAGRDGEWKDAWGCSCGEAHNYGWRKKCRSCGKQRKRRASRDRNQNNRPKPPPGGGGASSREAKLQADLQKAQAELAKHKMQGAPGDKAAAEAAVANAEDKAKLAAIDVELQALETASATMVKGGASTGEGTTVETMRARMADLREQKLAIKKRVLAPWQLHRTLHQQIEREEQKAEKADAEATALQEQIAKLREALAEKRNTGREARDAAAKLREKLADDEATLPPCMASVPSSAKATPEMVAAMEAFRAAEKQLAAAAAEAAAAAAKEAKEREQEDDSDDEPVGELNEEPPKKETTEPTKEAAEGAARSPSPARGLLHLEEDAIRKLLGTIGADVTQEHVAMAQNLINSGAVTGSATKRLRSADGKRDLILGVTPAVAAALSEVRGDGTAGTPAGGAESGNLGQPQPTGAPVVQAPA